MKTKKLSSIVHVILVWLITLFTFPKKSTKRWTVRDGILYSLGIKPTLGNSDDYFTSVVGITPTEYVVDRHNGKIYSSKSDGIITLLVRDKYRYIDPETFTLLHVESLNPIVSTLDTYMLGLKRAIKCLKKI
jgi:hypothetical protein